MPIGVIANVLTVILGGITGIWLGPKLNSRITENLNMIFGLCGIGMGITSVILMKNLPVVILSVILGTLIGLAIHLGDLFRSGGLLMQKGISRLVPLRTSGTPQEEFDSLLVTALVLFCASGTGIYGSIVSGFSGDHSILLAKSILDFFTAMIFACKLGAVTSLIAIPQLIVFLALYYLAALIYPATTPAMICDFKACGGLVLIATGFRIMKVREFPVADMIPAMVLVMPFSWLWTAFVPF